MNGAVGRQPGECSFAIRVAGRGSEASPRLLLNTELKCQEVIEKYKENNPGSSIRNIDNSGKSLLWTFFDYIICSVFLTKRCYHTSIIKQEYINGRN